MHSADVDFFLNVPRFRSREVLSDNGIESRRDTGISVEEAAKHGTKDQRREVRDDNICHHIDMSSFAKADIPEVVGASHCNNFEGVQIWLNVCKRKRKCGNEI